MTIALVCVADGRHEYHAASYASLLEHAPKFDQYVFVNDPDHKLGFSGAIQEGWSQIETDYLLHWEADFVVSRPVPVADMVAVLEAHPYLVQMALLRQPWNEAEVEAGGIVNLRPHEYEQASWNGHRWLEHRLCTTTNPSLWPRWVIERGWPDGPQSEGRFGIDLFASDPDLRAAYVGGGEQWCQHIGHVRSGNGY